MLNLLINIHGKVYKTGLRYYLKQRADQLKIKGYVSYGNDLSLLIVAEGAKPDIDKFLNHCRNGNIYSHIDNVHIKEVPPMEYYSFEVVDDTVKVENNNW